MSSLPSNPKRYDYSVEDCTYREVSDGTMVRFKDVEHLLTPSETGGSISTDYRSGYEHGYGDGSAGYPSRPDVRPAAGSPEGLAAIKRINARIADDTEWSKYESPSEKASEPPKVAYNSNGDAYLVEPKASEERDTTKLMCRVPDCPNTCMPRSTACADHQ